MKNVTGCRIIAFPDIDACHDWLLKYLEDNNA